MVLPDLSDWAAMEMWWSGFPVLLAFFILAGVFFFGLPSASPLFLSSSAGGGFGGVANLASCSHPPLHKSPAQPPLLCQIIPSCSEFGASLPHCLRALGSPVSRLLCKLPVPPAYSICVISCFSFLVRLSVHSAWSLPPDTIATNRCVLWCLRTRLSNSRLLFSWNPMLFPRKLGHLRTSTKKDTVEGDGFQRASSFQWLSFHLRFFPSSLLRLLHQFFSPFFTG